MRAGRIHLFRLCRSRLAGPSAPRRLLFCLFFASVAPAVRDLRRLGDFFCLNTKEAKSQGYLMAAWICADRLEAPKLALLKQLVLLYGDQPKSVPAAIKTPFFILVTGFMFAKALMNST